MCPATGLLHLGIGRNEYIDKSNRNKSAMRFGLWNLVPGRKSPLWELLPSEPVDFRLEPWWIVRSALPSLEAAGEGSMKVGYCCTSAHKQESMR